MKRAALIEQELAVAEAAWKAANEGKARVCARRAVGLATDRRVGSSSCPAMARLMEHLRQIQQDASFPLPIRQAAERLGTKVTKRDSAPFTEDPVSDARLIVEHLSHEAWESRHSS